MFYKASGPTWTFALLFIISLIFTSFNVSANVDINNTSYLLQPGASTEFFIDDSGQLTIKELADEEFKFRFAPWQPSLLNIEEQQKSLWLRFPVTNHTSEIVHPILSVDYQQQELPTLYLKYTSSASGKTVVKPLPMDRVNTTTFTLLPEQTATLYLKAPFNPELSKSLKLGSFDQLIKQQRYKFWQTGLVSGLLLSIILANAWLFLSMRLESKDSNSLSPAKHLSIFHLLLAAAASFILVFMASWQGYLSTWLYVPVTVEAWLYQLSLLLISLTFCQLAINLFGHQRPLLIRFFNTFSFIYLIAALWLPLSDSNTLNTNLLMLTLIGNASFCLSFWLVKPHRRYVSAWLLIPLAISQFIFALNHTGGLGISSRNTTWLLIQTLALTLGFLSLPARTNRKVLNKKQFAYNNKRPEELDEEAMNSLGHEMRTPLNGVMGMSELLLSTPLTPKQEDYVQTLRYAGYELGNLVNLLASSIKAQNQGIVSGTRLVDMHNTVEELVRHFQYRAEQQSIEIICFVDDNLSTECHIDGYRVSLILEAFLFYGLNQAEMSEVALSIQKDPTGNLLFEFSFKNPAGSSLEEKHLSGEHSLSEIKAETAMGLNLYLATHLIRQLGGEVSKRSNIISFTLPCNCGDEQAPPSQDETPRQGQYEHMRVLIADDSATCRKVLRQQCQLLGIPVIEAGDGLEALAMIRNETYLNRAFDIIILDHHMPGLKGLQVAERINADPSIDPMPAIIMLTGISNPPDKYQSSKLGISSILTKPVTRFTVQRALIKALGAFRT
ncbi:response regulator [Endozoicomonas elysicola]|uniref:histidine kinase n=1 Tax=Endozoicomonas elysicola TaxID=305900 RepID=A0A081K9B1_9GAMM|nr:response regulator [Endozoicomonas elysicola]KEI70737.1 hypothetical protein GV64_08270 [Endozoicomonas elysicola]